MMPIKKALELAYTKDLSQKEHIVFILCEFLNKDKSWIFLNPNVLINERKFFTLVDRFLNGEPFEYIFQKTSFYGMDFFIENGILIPRFDSEILLEKCLNLLNEYHFKNILEIGFGSGILSIALAKIKKVSLQACDINPLALNLATKNAKYHQVLDHIDFKLCDFKNLSSNYDFIFSNPPYIKNSYPLDKWVKNEPHNALYGGEKGWEILEDIIIFAKNKKCKILACEFGYDQKEILAQILNEYNFKAEFFTDYHGFDRVFVAHNLKY
ncbi:protein-(glutamine-N5) methyltransferase [Campylobacter insulaenigrae NCTC 12927]|uniref:peptide chain release factor N(5)-glutamine methyltransferase n=2 Tax=Campylobacter insulaenigrae TaxID=260714 RepID=A0A0A8H005_9BACT|nr:protein-(glutamine-N5) methyltransferase [Campylobacter insulaenigrae NCTC 12927]VEH93487.1 modification methylase, HemK family [Campylobacter insulaenigrae]